MKKKNLKNNCLYPFYFDGNLESDRFETEDIISAINLAKSRFPGERIYYVTDKYELNADLMNVKMIEPASLLQQSSALDQTQKVFVCAFESDEQLLPVLREITSRKNSYYFTPLKYYPTARYFHRNDLARKVLIQEKKIDLPKFEVADFENIIQAIDITREIEGDYVEIGVYHGRSAHMALHYMRESDIRRKSYFVDIFEGFTYESAIKSSDALWANSHTDTSYEQVKSFLSDFDNHEILKMDIIADALPKALRSIAVCNVDVDLYEAVLASLTKIAHLMCIGGIIIVEDQGHTPALGGGYLATSEFLGKQIARNFIPVHMTSGQMFLIRYK